MLLPGDQIVKVGDEVVVSSPRQRVISLIRFISYYLVFINASDYARSLFF